MLAPHILGATAVAAYTYMAMVPLIQPPIIKALTTEEELPKATPLIGMLMAGNLLKVCGVIDRLVETASTSFVDILTIVED